MQVLISGPYLSNGVRTIPSSAFPRLIAFFSRHEKGQNLHLLENSSVNQYNDISLFNKE